MKEFLVVGQAADANPLGGAAPGVALEAGVERQAVGPSRIALPLLKHPDVWQRQAGDRLVPQGQDLVLALAQLTRHRRRTPQRIDALETLAGPAAGLIAARLRQQGVQQL